jgi:single-strand DNA-binding protein
MSLCKVTLIGNLGRDPEMRYTPDGRPVTQFSMAVNRSSKNQAGEWVEETEWFRITVWGNQAERAAENLRKGGKVYVEGRFRTREWEGQDGAKRTALEVTADQIVNLERRSRDDAGDASFEAAGAAGATAAPRVSPQRAPQNDSDLDDLPF